MLGWLPRAARCPQLAGGPAGPADPAAYGAAGNGEVPRDEPVPAPLGGGDQGLSDQVGGAGVARQQASVEHDVGDGTAGAPGPVRTHRPHCAAQLADRALAGPPPGPQGLAAVRAAVRATRTP